VPTTPTDVDVCRGTIVMTQVAIAWAKYSNNGLRCARGYQKGAPNAFLARCIPIDEMDCL